MIRGRSGGSSRRVWEGRLLHGEIVDLDAVPLDEPPVSEGDDSAAHAATNGAVDEERAWQEELAEQQPLDAGEM